MLEGVRLPGTILDQTYQGLPAPSRNMRLGPQFSTRGQAEWVRGLVRSGKGPDLQRAWKSMCKAADDIRYASGEGTEL